ncbi:MAG: YihY/virulence factor BrkB family protein [Pseudomonadota bacterium]
MPNKTALNSSPLSHPLRFSWRVIKAFNANQGLLLSGALAYYTLLSIIPIFTLLLVVLSHVIDDTTLLYLIRENLQLFVPGLTDLLLEQVSKFIEHRAVIGWVGILVMLFFSSMAFTILENAMSVIFFHRVEIRRRHFLVSAIIPYLYIMLVGVGISLITLASGALESLDKTSITLFAWQIAMDDISHTAIYLLGIFGLMVLLSSIYLVMPVGRISLSHALVGGTVATLLWELARHLLIWYFSTLSIVNLIYGSLATGIVALLSLEVAAMILLFGAQVIAEYENSFLSGEKAKTPETMHT